MSQIELEKIFGSIWLIYLPTSATNEQIEELKKRNEKRRKKQTQTNNPMNVTYEDYMRNPVRIQKQQIYLTAKKKGTEQSKMIQWICHGLSTALTSI